ncbi:MAG: hybrid sensor histidine kinase/response regulator [Calditrichaeota bacterium]|nr:MAG: hybrid sensor histidine kinase/response regulator [Calditrichota bacterium]
MIFDPNRAAARFAHRVARKALGAPKKENAAIQHGVEAFLRAVLQQSHSPAFSERIKLFRTVIRHCRQYGLSMDEFLQSLKACGRILAGVKKAAGQNNRSDVVHLCNKAILSIRDIRLLWAVFQELNGALSPLTSQPNPQTDHERIWAAWVSHTQNMLQRRFVHSLNNLLTGLLPSAQLLLDGIDNPQQRYYAKVIASTATRLAEESQQMRLFRAEAGRKPASLNTAVFLQTLYEVLRRSLGRHASVATDLPADFTLVVTQPLEVLALMVAASHLIVKSAGYLPPLVIGARPFSTPLPEVTQGPPGHQLFVATQFTKQTKAQPGQDAPEAVQTLPVTRALLEQSAQRLGYLAWAREDKDGRKWIGITIPASEATAGQRETDDGNPAQSRHPCRKLLLVEDDEDLSEIITLMAGELGFEIQWAGSGRQGLQFLKRSRQTYCAVLLDLSLPDVTARQFLLALRRMFPDLPVILATGYGEQEWLQQLRGIPIQGILKKPFTFASFKKVLQDIMGRYAHR